MLSRSPSLNWIIVRLGRVGSTQKVARDNALSGEPSGLVLVAESQTEGRGSHGRQWSSLKGGLYMTVVLRLRKGIGLLPVLAGVAVAEAIKTITGIEARLKWPNDILVGGRKVGGIIAESGWSEGEVRFALLGIGVNVNNPLPEDLPEATTLSTELGEDLEMESFLQALLGRLDLHLRQIETDPDAIIDSWRSLTQTLGMNIEVTDMSGELVRGLAVDIDADGALILETERGRRKVFATA
jgi:BirA family biotin operon repressor/biotin-[acetyl-CoA-carboxylase] ligase